MHVPSPIHGYYTRPGGATGPELDTAAKRSPARDRVLVSLRAFRPCSCISPQAVYSTLNIEMEEPHLEGEAFHVLKWFSTFPKGSAPVSGVEYMCQMDHSTALSCVQELWRLKFIRTVVQAPGEWNGQYAITQKGADYVRTHGT